MNSIAPPDLLQVHISESGEEEFEQLVSLLEDTPQSFALIIVRSDFDTSTRDALLEHLGHRLAPLPLHTVPLSRESFDVPLLLAEMQPRIEDAAVIAITGLEETPQIAAEPEDRAGRPPAIAILNHGREAIRRIGHPTIVWCDPLAYAALREHAPDFFDHYTGLFTFLDAAPAQPEKLILSQESHFDRSLMPNGRPRMVSALSPRATSPGTLRFYEDQVETLTAPTADRARALVGLADALFSYPLNKLTIAQVERGEVAVQEALDIFQRTGHAVESARAHALLAMLIKRRLAMMGNQNPILDPRVQAHIAAALKTFTENEHPVEWASLMWMQADDALREGLSEDSLRRSLPFFQAAQRVYTPQAYPFFWASCEMNLGNIYANLPYSRSNSKKAIVHFEAAARVLQQLNQPLEWALNQLLLGKALSSAAKQSRDRNEQAKLLRRALECFAKAQHVYEQLHETHGITLALTLEAMTWSELPTGNRREHLRRSADAWMRRSQLLAKDDLAQSALGLQQAGVILLELATRTRMSGDLNEAREAFEAAHSLYEKIGNSERARQCADRVLALEVLLKKAA